MENFELIFNDKINIILGSKDPAHDILHVKRVVKLAKQLALEENGKLEVILPAAWLHDFVNLAKDHPKRKEASQMAGQNALIFLRDVQYPEIYFDEIYHAICAHSYSAGIKPETLEAKIVQDADRLDALGAIGLARLFSITTQLDRPFYSEIDPFALKRSLDDKEFGIDHVYIKLQKISQTMNTESAKKEAARRFNFIEEFLDELKKEI